METLVNHTCTRIACALALSATMGCADITFSYVEDAVLTVPVKDIGSECETDDPVNTDIARAHVEQDGDVCAITADVLVRAIEYADLEDSLDTIDLQGPDTYWDHGGICWRPAVEEDAGQPYEKCDFGPYVQAQWRAVGEDTWSSNPEFPDAATAQLDVAYYPGPVQTLDDVALGASPAMTFTTSGANFPYGPVTFDHSQFFDSFLDAVGPDEEDLYSVVHAHVEVPMTVIGDFTEYEYNLAFAYQMYVQGAVEGESMWELFFEGLFGGGED